MYRFLHNRGVISRVFEGIRDYDNRLVKVLGGRLGEPVDTAVTLMADLRHKEAGLPRYPLAYRLGG